MYGWKDGVANGLVVVAVMASLASNAAFGVGIGNTSCNYSMNFSPSRRAFAIWSLIYPLSIAAVAEQLMTHFIANEPMPFVGANVLYAIAWLSAAVWTPAFTANTKRSLIASAIFLVITSVCALSATIYASFWRLSTNNARRWVSGSAFSMLASWTALAATLNGGIAVKANDPRHSENCDRSYENYTIFDPINTAYSTTVPFVISVGVSTVSVALPDPVLPLPVAWAVMFMRPSYWNYAALTTLSFGSVAAFVRVYAG